MTTAAPTRITPLIHRQHAHVRQLREDSAAWIRAAFATARATARPHIRQFAAAYGAERARVQEADDTATVSLLWTAGHLVKLQTPLMHAVSQAALAAQAATIASQTKALLDGNDAGQARVKDIANGAAVAAGVIAASRFGRSGYSGRPLSSYYTPLAHQAWQKAQRAAYAGAANGQDDSDLEDALDGVIGGIASYALLVDGAEIMSGWRDGLFSAFEANSDIVVGWQRVELGPDPCPECERENFSIHTLDEDFETHPLCLGDAIPLTISDLASL